ncbi:hypothetical protein DFP72DRAFT_1162428 [Ephemerocybe angulata]|uniref:phytol kinase n=1 Tax=Ephemerocybe angulata TaxID=980116 RepID=A0A8H6MGE0_9AGAR|nr:hypothetical protein DFP72DRAFT_1162428 [Tulosesus angulatus]
MSSRMNSEAAARAYRLRKSYKLLEDVRSSPFSVDSCDALTRHLIAEHDFDLLEAIIEPLGAEYLPRSGHHRQSNEEIFKNATAAAAALGKVSTFFRALVHTTPREAVTGCTRDYLFVFLTTRWRLGGAFWMTWILSKAPKLVVEADLMPACTDLLLSIGDNKATKETYEIKEEIALMNHTIDVLFVMLERKDERGRYWQICREPTNPCLLMKALRNAFDTEARCEAIQARILHPSNRPAKRSDIAALVDRGPLFVTGVSGERLAGAAKSLRLLIYSLADLGTNAALWNEFLRQDMLAKHSLALRTLIESAQKEDFTDKQFWASVSTSTARLLTAVLDLASDPAECLAQMFNAGLLYCVVHCLPYGSWKVVNGCDLPLRRMVPYFYIRNVFEAARERGDAEAFLQRQGLPAKVETMCLEVDVAIRASSYVYGESQKNKCIALCSNINHRSHEPSANDSPIRGMKTCGRCRAVTYCSPACQEEDWHALHFRECRRLSERSPYTNRHARVTLNSFQANRDQLAHLEYALNTSYSNAVAQGIRRKPGRPWDEGVSCFLVDLASTSPEVSPSQTQRALADGLVQKHDFTYLDLELQPRILRCIEEAEGRANDGAFIVEATFPRDQDTWFYIFASVQNIPDPLQRMRRKIANSVIRIGVPNASYMGDMVINNNLEH